MLRVGQILAVANEQNFGVLVRVKEISGTQVITEAIDKVPRQLTEADFAMLALEQSGQVN